MSRSRKRQKKTTTYHSNPTHQGRTDNPPRKHVYNMGLTSYRRDGRADGNGWLALQCQVGRQEHRVTINHIRMWLQCHQVHSTVNNGWQY